VATKRFCQKTEDSIRQRNNCYAPEQRIKDCDRDGVDIQVKEANWIDWHRFLITLDDLICILLKFNLCERCCRLFL
jgi:hypothetical protein